VVLSIYTISIVELDYCKDSIYYREATGMKTALQWCVLFAVPLLGQEAKISGRVMDSEQKCVPGVVVTVTGPDSALKRLVLSDRQGKYSFGELPAGRYRIQAIKPGFTPVTEEYLDVRSGQSEPVTFRLTIEKASDLTSEVVLSTVLSSPGDRPVSQP
jgi:hypothetical protein